MQAFNGVLGFFMGALFSGSKVPLSHKHKYSL